MRFVAPLLVCCWMGALPIHALAQDPRMQREAAESAIYSVVLDSLYRAPEVRAYLVADSTRGILSFGARQEDLIVGALKQLSDLPPELISDFAQVNQAPRLLVARDFSTRLPVQLLGGTALRSVVEATMHSSGYPSPLPAPGHITFSRAGFAPDGQLAAVYVEFRCGGRCGSGEILVLHGRAGTWQIQRQQPVVVF